ncbi:unnamed protein product, partial [Linum tenue]
VIVHCASKDSDLGGHLLDFNASEGWNFEPNYFGGTLFWCNDAFQDGRLSLVAYNQESDLTQFQYWPEAGQPAREMLFRGRSSLVTRHPMAERDSEFQTHPGTWVDLNAPEPGQPACGTLFKCSSSLITRHPEAERDSEF